MDPVEGTRQLTLGRHLLARYGCAHCHAVTQPDGTLIVPVDEPPSLEHIAEKTSREWIFASVKVRQAYAVSSTMPNYRFNDQQAADIAAFLIAQSTPSENPGLRPPSMLSRLQPAVITPSKAPACTELCSAHPATPFKTRPETWWAATWARN